ncbi:F-box domain-containing protein [Mycena chlorophos]|uniref:F-box domain-containing protein n=1 Tax=Mycena chlorophos TaxID=658473 RepID=A0A8H6TL39_MYCCL|nr:F-box domain-containing protein [Mycena chlorophos]
MSNAATLFLLFHHLLPMDFSHLSATNHIPAEAEAQQIRALLATAEQEQQGVQKDLAEIRKKERQLVQSHAALTKRIRMLKSILSPLRWVPAEILSRIFLAATRTDEAVEGPPRPSNAERFMRMSQVSSRWRAVAHTTPHLWRTLSFDLGPYLGPGVDGVVSTILHFAEHCQPHGLDLALKVDRRYTRGMPLAALWSCSRHIASLKLEIPGNALTPLVGLPERAFARLGHLQIKILDTSDQGLAGGIPGLSNIPLLHHLDLSARSTNSLRKLLPATAACWSPIRTLRLNVQGSLGIWNIYRVLGSIPNLAVLDLRMTHAEEGPEEHLEEVCLDMLRSLTLHVSSNTSDDIASLLDIIVAPQLTTLDLNGRFEIPTIMQFLSNAGATPPITHLRLENIVDGDNNPELLEFFRSLPAVTDLSLRSMALDDDILSALELAPTSAGGAHEVFFPALQRLEIGVHVDLPMSIGPFADVIESRLPGAGNGSAEPGRCLVHAELFGQRDEWGSDPDWPKLVALRDRGVLVV